MAKNEVAKATRELTLSERFTQKVLSEFGNTAGEIRVSSYQRALVQNYFIAIDRMLRTAEDDRTRKNANNKDHKYDNELAYIWKNINLNELSLDIVHYARLGLDMMESNHLFPIPYKNKKNQKYDITFMVGYNGIKYIAENYALEKPKGVRIELVHKEDHFKPIKKSRGNDIETYEFDIENPFDRGPIVGGFGYIEYDDPTKNELVMMSMADITKRKPEYASANFWGGEVKEWQHGKQVEVKKEGWLEEMCTKTLIREVYSAKHIPRDPRKVDDSYQRMKDQERQLQDASESMQQTIDVEANSVPFEEDIPQMREPEPKQEIPIEVKEAAPVSKQKETVSKERELNPKQGKTDQKKSEPGPNPYDDDLDMESDDMFKNFDSPSATAAPAPTF
ncbi:recombinase RecT [Megasphaera cerevisiae]|uniref:recombinase RecT n=1 Tax=Megasphaera cerevisiae TaxID=39029 RepID=UPI00065B0841|nr:recombinase RecT [Megasphaera cerevisiae]SKA11250.1 recombination protein RecT [Megasphaera cerevisiae DSM 20462]